MPWEVKAFFALVAILAMCWAVEQGHLWLAFGLFIIVGQCFSK